MQPIRAIRLVGPGGSGKSTIGHRLAHRLGVAFIDLDTRFVTEVGDIGPYIDARGYDAYAHENVCTYVRATATAAVVTPCVLALSSGFMTYRRDIHPDYERICREIIDNQSTFVLLPTLEPEACVAEIVRRQIARPFARSAEREEQVIRARLPIYLSIPRTKVTTMGAIEAVVELLAAQCVEYRSSRTSC